MKTTPEIVADVRTASEPQVRSSEIVVLRQRAVSAKERYEMSLENICRPYLQDPLVRIFEPLPLPRSQEMMLARLREDATNAKSEYTEAWLAQHNP